MSVPEHSILQLKGQEGKTMEFDVAPGRETVRVSLGKETMVFKFVDLWAIVFAAAGPEQQASMVPVKQTEMVTYRRIHRIKLTKALPAGAEVKCHCEINVEKSVVEGLRGMVEQQNKSAMATDSAGLPIIGAK